jgi:hypothetical protein
MTTTSKSLAKQSRALLESVKNECLAQFRYDGKRFWHNCQGSWSIFPCNDLRQHLRIEGLCQPEAQQVIQAIKMNPVNDPAWHKKVEWHRFTGGRTIMHTPSGVLFLASGGKCTRCMTEEIFDRLVKARFPDGFD